MPFEMYYLSLQTKFNSHAIQMNTTGAKPSARWDLLHYSDRVTIQLVYMLQIIIVSQQHCYGSVESNQKNALIQIALHNVIVPRACQISGAPHSSGSHIFLFPFQCYARNCQTVIHVHVPLVSCWSSGSMRRLSSSKKKVKINENVAGKCGAGVK